MGEKRHWLVRLREGNRDDAYNMGVGPNPPQWYGYAGWTIPGGNWLTHIPVLEAEARYGHKLEPGGGPVDVSEWFPEGGRKCGNCGCLHARICHADRIPHADVCDCEDWKPREQAIEPIKMSPHVKAMMDCVQEIQDEIFSATAIPPGEEGGRTMERYPVEVWDKDDEGKRKKLHADLDTPGYMVAKSPQTARDKVVAELAKANVDPESVEIVICNPLAR